MPLFLTFATPDKPLLLEREIESVIAPTEQGEVQILPGHARYLASLGTGVVRYRDTGKTYRLALSGGFLSVEGEHIKILANEASSAINLDEANALKNDLTSAESKLRSAKTIDENEVALREIEKAKTWIALSKSS